jgi:hypothetical protein
MTRRTVGLASAALLLFAGAVSLPPRGHAGLLAPPPFLTAMWEGKDAVSVRAALRGYAAQGDAPDASAGRKLEAGEAAWWLGVQDARAGRADSALSQWRRAMRLRGDFDEGFALIDALFRRGRPADLAEAHALSAGFAQNAAVEMPRRSAEAHARLAWAQYLRGRPDSALAMVRTWCEGIHGRPLWIRRFAKIELDGGDPASAWAPLVTLSARTRQRDDEVEFLLARARGLLGYSDEFRRMTVMGAMSPLEHHEKAIAAALSAHFDSAAAKDGFPLRWLFVPAASGAPKRAPVLFVLAPLDTLAAPDTLVAALAAAGHPVALVAPRGSYGAIGKGATTPDAWFGRENELHARAASDAAQVMALLGKRGVGATGWIVGAAGDMAPVALELARARKNTPALLLVAPKLPVVEVAEFRARLRAAGTRTFIQVSPEEPESLELADLIARMTQPGQVRVADSGLAGRGAAIFRAEPMVSQRLIAWLEERAAK